MRGLAGKICIVAGGGTGIGQATAVRLAEEGCTVVIGDINGEAAAETARRASAKGAKAASIAFDIADEASVGALINCAVDRFGGLDAIHINANDMRIVQEDGDALETSLAVFDRTIAVGLRGHLLCTRAALPEILKRGGGAIVYTTSGSAFIGEPTRVSYGIVKAGLTALVRHVARRWGKEGIRANGIAPGLVITEQHKHNVPQYMIDAYLPITAAPRVGESDDIAAMVAMLFSDDGAWVTGQIIAVDGGVTMRA